MKDLIIKTSQFLNITIRDQLDAVSLLALRLMFGGSMLLAHGLGKLEKFEGMHETFPDPMGVGSTMSLSLVVFAEVVCAGLICLGFLTRLAAFPLVITMAVAIFVIHAEDPFGKKELALAYLVAYLVIFLRGPGKISLDGFLSKTMR